MSSKPSKSRNISKNSQNEILTSNINNKKLRNHLDKVISEFSIVPKKLEPLIAMKHTAKTLFWGTVYLAFSYLTISSTFELIQQYRGDEVTTNMKAMVNKEVTYFPNITICLKMNISKLFGISSSSGFNYTSAWLRFFKKTTSHEGIFKVKEGQVYDDEIYLSLLKYLSMIYEAERAWEPGLAQMSTFHLEESDDWIALKKVLVPNIERYNITLEQLKSVFDGKFCSLPVHSSYYSYYASYDQLLGLNYDRMYERECIAGSRISFIGKDTICFRLIGYKKYLRQLGTTEYIKLYLYDDGRNQKWHQELTIDLGSESRSTPRRATTRNETNAYYYNRFTGTVGIVMDVGIKALYRKLPYVKGDIQCSSDTSREECENKCLRGWIRAYCHCSPITFNLTTDMSSNRNCTVDDYSNCLKKYTENATYLCTKKCVPLCEQWYYEYGFEALSDTPSSFVQISPRTFDFVIIEQVFTWNSFEEFIGAMGGALGIWLGLDFVIIAEFIVKLLAKLFKKISNRNVPNSEENKQGENANMKRREENIEGGILSSNGAGSGVIGHQKEFEESAREVGGTSIRQINEKQRISGKKRESTAWVEGCVQQRRKRSNIIKADSAILEDKMGDIVANVGRQGLQKVNITDNVDAVQEESTVHANCSITQNWLLQKIVVLFLNGDFPTKKSTMCLRLAEKLFWAAIYLIGSLFTTMLCFQLISLYLEDEAVYYPSLILNRTVSLPTPSVCIFYHSNPFFASYGNISNALMDYFNQSNIDRTLFIQISHGKAWPEQLISIGLLYLSILGASEINYNDVNFISEYESQLNTSAGEDILIRNDIDQSINDILLPKLLAWNVTANELRQKLGAELARMAELKVSFTNSNRTTDIVNETSFYTAAVTNNFFCYSLSSVINFTDPDDTLEFSINRASCPQLLSGWGGYIIFSDFLLEPKSAQFNIRLYSVRVFDSTYFDLGYGFETRTLISVHGLYTSRPVTKGVKYCSPNTTKSYCRAKCRIDLIERICNCSPTYWALMIGSTSGLDECTLHRYMECLNYNASEDLACKDACLPFCTATYFRSDLTGRQFPQEYNNTAVAIFSVKDGIYMSIEENPIFTFSDLLIKVLLDT